MKKYFLIISVMLVTINAFSQNERKFVRKGNDIYEEAIKDTTRIDTSKFSAAETEYRKALNKKPGNEKWEFNLADALYKQMRFEEAEQKFTELHEKLESPEEKARALHNRGNSQLMQKKIDESIESYKEALRKNPDDIETKYNLAYAQSLKKQQEQQQQQQQNQDQNKDQNKDQQKNQDQQNKDQNQDNKDQQKQDQQQQQQNQQNQEQKQQQQQQQQNKISKQDAEQLLQALQNDERDIQEKVKKAKAVKARKSNVEKEW